MATSRKREVSIDVVVDDKQAKAKLKGVGDEAQKTGGKFDGLKGAVGGLLAGFAVQQVADFALETAKMGESAANAADSAEKVLGPALDGLHERLDGTRQMLGFNVGELDQFVAQYGLLTESLGDKAQAEFLGWLFETGGELAAFNGKLDEAPAAIDAIGAALRGEFDSLEQFGVKLSQAAVNEKALELAADPANTKLSEQELQLMAIQELINEKAAPALGTLAGAEDDLAVKTNEANVRLEDLQIQLGQKMAPAIADVIAMLVDMIDVLGGAESQFADTGASFHELVDDVHEWIAAIQSAIDWIRNGLLPALDDFTARRGGAGLDASQGGSGSRNAGPVGGGGNRRGRNSSGLQPFHEGGIVPGSPGQEVPILAEAGERIIPAGGRGGNTFNIYTMAMGGKLAREIERISAYHIAIGG